MFAYQQYLSRAEQHWPKQILWLINLGLHLNQSIHFKWTKPAPSSHSTPVDETGLIVGLLRPLFRWVLPCKTNTSWLKDKEELGIWTHLSAVSCRNTNTPPVRAQPQLPASSQVYGKFQLGAGCGALTRPLALASLSKHCRLSSLCNIFLKQNLGNKITSSS